MKYMGWDYESYLLCPMSIRQHILETAQKIEEEREAARRHGRH